jgi:UDP-N-acetylmuramoylalanine--D-glutamate ligase
MSIMRHLNKVTILGLGKSGYAAARYLAGKGVHVILSEYGQIKGENIALADELKQLGVEVESGGHSDKALEQAELIITSPGIAPDTAVIKKAYALGKDVISDVEFACTEGTIPIIAITGTNGKSTTTSLISHIFQSNGLIAPPCGNIGTPVLDYLSNNGNMSSIPNYLIMEVSSYQLFYTKHFAPYISVWLNLTPDHLEWHKNMDAYIAAKENIFTHQDQFDTKKLQDAKALKQAYAVINVDDPIVASRKIKAKAFPFSQQSILEGADPAAFVLDNWLCYRLNGKVERVCAIDEMPIIGQHNIENALAAIAVSTICGLSTNQIAKAIKKFKALEHRLEYVDTIDGVAFYNDSKATNPESSIKALQAFKEKIVLIAGGRDKGTDLQEFSKTVRNQAVAVILLGEAKERFAQALKEANMANVYMVNSMEEAINLGLKLKLGPLVLSPACASYDMFKNFEDRGNVFKDIIHTKRAQVGQPS